MLYEAPIFFEKNRVFRVYSGGKLLGEFLGDGSDDGNYPEEWVASAVCAMNCKRVSEKEGISKVKDSGMYLDDLFRQYPKEMLGGLKKMGILVKYLDSAIRLPVQAHPDQAFSKTYFDSDFGKEECWIVLATRPGACVYFGFQEGVGRKELERAVQAGETDKNAMVDLLVQYPVAPGDVIFIPAKAAHAIGAGCLILEVQEPTDFTIQPERWCGDYKLTDYEMYLGLQKEVAMECFRFEQERQVKLMPELLLKQKDVKIERLLGPEQTKKFQIKRITCEGGSYMLEHGAAVCCVIQGTGQIIGAGYECRMKQGEYFFLPYAAREKYRITGDLTVIECFV